MCAFVLDPLQSHSLKASLQGCSHAYLFPASKDLGKVRAAGISLHLLCLMQVQVSIEMLSRLVARAVWITNSSQPRLDGSTVNPVTCINLAGCSPKPGQSAAQLLAYCIQLCPNLQELVACKVGAIHSTPTLPLSADGALQVLRACKRHLKVKPSLRGVRGATLGHGDFLICFAHLMHAQAMP